VKIWNNHVSIQVRSFLITASLTLGALSSSPLLADTGGACHFHGNKPAVEATVLTCAEIHKERLIKKGKIDASWEAIKHDSIQQVEAKRGKKEWQVTSKDASANDKAKETLYMFFSLPGNFLAANFTGN
jgi:hypothetical protein